MEITEKESKQETVKEEKIMAYLLPVDVMNQVIQYIAKGPWVEVNELMNNITKNLKPINLKDEKQNSAAPKE